MRTTLWILLLGASLAFAAGCKRDDPPPPKEDGGFKISKKGGGNLIANIRGTVDLTERKNAMRGIKILYDAYSLEKPNVSQRNLADFLTSIMRENRSLHEAIKEGYYRVNLQALSGSDVIAHERDIDTMGYLSVLGDGDIRYLSAQELKQAGGMP